MSAYPFTAVRVGMTVTRFWTVCVLSEVARLVMSLTPGTHVQIYNPGGNCADDWTYIVPKKPRRRFKCT